MRKYNAWIKLLRIKHYIKNLIILFPMFFSKEITMSNVTTILIGIIIFSLVSSMVYILNDISDIAKDRIHPEKCNRPLPSGDLTVKEAKIGWIVIGVITCGLVFICNINYLGILIVIGYLLINIFYSKYAKNIPVMDVLILAFGYLLRIFLGAVLINITISNWLYLTVLFGSLFMGLGKRRGEMKYVDSNNTRKVLEFYNEEFLDKNMYMSLTITIVFYALWCVSSEISSNYPHMVWTTILAYAICMKYTLILEKGSEGDPISVIFSDRILFGLLLLYSVVILMIMYF